MLPMKPKSEPSMGTSLPFNPMVPSIQPLDSGGKPKIEFGDWRSQLQPNFRQQMIDIFLETLKGHLPVSGEVGLSELRKMAVRFEEKTFIASTSQSDYLGKVYRKMLPMESKYQPPMGTSLPSIPMVPTNKPLDSGGEPKIEAGDWRSQLPPDTRHQILNKLMYTKSLFIRYGGPWDDKEQCYNGGQLKGIIVPHTLKYNELRDRIYELTRCSSSEFNIIMRVKYKLDCESPPVYIMDDDDVQFLLQEVGRSKPQIFISFEQIQQQITFENTKRKLGEDVIPTGDSNETNIFPSVVLMGNGNTNQWESYTSQYNTGRKRGRDD